jgi:hypothetical protein
MPVSFISLPQVGQVGEMGGTVSEETGGMVLEERSDMGMMRSLELYRQQSPCWVPLWS